MTCIEEVTSAEGLSAFEITVEGDRYVLASEDEKESTSWFEAFSLVQKHLVAGERRAGDRPVPEKKGWLLKKLTGEGVGSTTIWKSRWCELHERHLEIYDTDSHTKLLGKIPLSDKTKITTVGEQEDRLDGAAAKQFKVMSDDKPAVFMATSVQERDDWILALKSTSMLIRVGSRKAKGALVEREGFLKKGDITAQAKKKTRYFKQRGSTVAYFLNEKTPKPLGRFTLRDATVTAAGDLDIEVYSGTRCFVVTAENEVERAEWLEALSEGVEGVTGNKRHPHQHHQQPEVEEDFFSEEEIVISQVPRPPPEHADEAKPITKSHLILKQIGSSRIWKMRYLVLRGGTLFYYKSRQSKKPTGVLVLSRSAAAFAGEDVQSCSFVVVLEKRRLVFGTASVEERNKWIDLITEAIRASPHATNSDQFGDFSEEDRDLDVAVNSEEAAAARERRGRSGWLEKQTGPKKEWQRRWFVQRGSVVSYYSDEKETSFLGRLVLRPDDSVISPRVAASSADTPKAEPQPFIIETGEGRKWSLMARDAKDLAGWVADVKKAIAVSAAPRTPTTPGSESPLAAEEFSENEDSTERVRAARTVAAIQGWLYKQAGAGKVWRRRWFVCQKDVITYFRNSAGTQACGQMALRHGDVVTAVWDDPARPFGVVLTSNHPARRLRLAAQSKEEQQEWVNVIGRNIPREPAWQDDRDYQELSEPEDPGTGGGAGAGGRGSLETSSTHFSFIVSQSTSGWLLKYVDRERAWKKRFFVQQGPYVAYYKTDRAERAVGRFQVAKDDIFNGNLLMRSQQRVFRLTTDGRTITLSALTQGDYDEWVRTLYFASTQPVPAGNQAGDDSTDVFSEDDGPPLSPTSEKKPKPKKAKSKE